MIIETAFGICRGGEVEISDSSERFVVMNLEAALEAGIRQVPCNNESELPGNQLE